MWSIAFYKHKEGEDPGQPVALFSNLPEAVGDKILSAILPVVRAAETASRMPEPWRQAIAALASAVIDPVLTSRRKRTNR